MPYEIEGLSRDNNPELEKLKGKILTLKNDYHCRLESAKEFIGGLQDEYPSPTRDSALARLNTKAVEYRNMINELDKLI
jgi:hypothetical protein